MDRHSSCQSLIRRAFPAHAAKRLAAALDVPIETARNFVHRSVPVSRAPQIAAALLPELERQRAEIEETIEQTRRLLAELNGGKG